MSLRDLAITHTNDRERKETNSALLRSSDPSSIYPFMRMMKRRAQDGGYEECLGLDPKYPCPDYLSFLFTGPIERDDQKQDSKVADILQSQICQWLYDSPPERKIQTKIKIRDPITKAMSEIPMRKDGQLLDDKGHPLT